MRHTPLLEPLENRQFLSAAYRIIDLSVSAAAAGFTSASVSGIAPSGNRIVGEGSNSQQANAPLLWTTRAHGARRVSVLPTIGAGAAIPRAVNNAGQIVGEFHLTSDNSSPTHACLWQLSSRGRYYVTDLGTFRNTPASAFSRALAINSQGLIVGTVGGLPADLQKAATWALRPNGRIIATALQGNAFEATAVNDAGQIAGTGWGSQAMVEVAYLWRSNTSNGIVIGNGYSTAIGTDGSISANEDYGDNIIGNAIFYRRRSTTRFSQVPVPALPGGFRSHVADLNSSGTLVGDTANPADPGSDIAVSWTPSGGALTIHRLSDQIAANSGWASLDNAFSIDFAGEIIGSGTFGGKSHPFLLVPST